MSRFTKVVSLSAALFAAAFAVSSSAQEIVRTGEGRNFYNSIFIPAGAEILYMSGTGADPLPDGSYGDMEQQTVDIFNKFKATMEEQGWSMADIVQVRVYGVAGEDGTFDFAGFNRGYQQFFGTEENPMKPVRATVEIADLVVDGWLVEVEVRAYRMPK